jgi:hypothetical protein
LPFKDRYIYRRKAFINRKQKIVDKSAQRYLFYLK